MSEINENGIDSQESAAEHMASSGEIRQGYLTGPGLYQFPVEYAVIDGLAIHEGCIELGPVEEVEEEAARVRASQYDRKATEAAGADGQSYEAGIQMGVGLPGTSRFLWTDGVVPYAVSNSVPNQSRVNDAIRHIEAMTAMRFVKRTNANAGRYPNYIEIISNGNNSWSSSAIGMRGGRQVIRYADGHSWPILVHEFLHAFGVYHEQSRSDRDDFVEIRWNNILDGPPPPGEINALGNFQKKSGAVDYFDYDYGSLMHYHGTSFAKDRSKPTIVPRKPGVTIGQREAMSYGDRQTIAKMYERFFSRGYAGVWRAGTGRYALWVNAEWQSFHDKWQEWSNQGLRLQDIHVQRRSGKTVYSGVFLPGSGRYALWANVDWTSFHRKWQEWSNQGLRLADLHVHRMGNQNRYSGVFLPGQGAHGLWVNTSWTNFRNKWQEWSSQGLRLVDLHVHRVGNQNRYSGVFLPGQGGHGLWASTTWSSFVAKWQEWSDQGLRLVDLNLHRVGNSIRYSGVFLPGNDAHYLWANVTFEGFRAKWQELAEQGLRLIDFEIANPEAGAGRFADADMSAVDAPASSAELEAFGGMMGGDLVGLPEAPSSMEDGGGGMGLGNEDGVSPLAEPEDEAKGGAYFPAPSTDSDDEARGLGGAFFETAPADMPSAEPEYHGEAVLPNQA